MRGVAQLQLLTGLFRKGSIRRQRRSFQLFVKPGREEEKFIVAKGKTGFAFGNSALSKDHALEAFPERLTNDSPFFESGVHTNYNSPSSGHFRQKETGLPHGSSI